jgi:hypothetical protein
MTKTVQKLLEINNIKFTIEIYPPREGEKQNCFEIFPSDYHAALYAFSNKDKLNKLIIKKFL